MSWEVRPEPAESEERAALLAAAEQALAGGEESAWWRSGLEELVPLQPIHACFWPAITHRQRPPSPSPRLPSLDEFECALWLGARDPEARQHYLKEH